MATYEAVGQSPLMSTKEVAALLHVNRDTVPRLVPAACLVSGGKWWSRFKVERWAAGFDPAAEVPMAEVVAWEQARSIEVGSVEPHPFDSAVAS